MDSHDEQHQRRKEERRRQKEMLKALETPEQKRQRRLEKKEEKERVRKRMAGWDEQDIGYTNEDNPFGDSNLHETFVWKKKYEKMGVKNIVEEEIDQINKQKMVKNRQELEKVKMRRLERERERELRMEEQSRMQREKEAEQFKEWAKQEDYFHLKQAKLRSKLRIKDGRAKPIDHLARYINVFGENVVTHCKSDSEDNSSDSSRLQKLQTRREEEEEELLDRIKVLSSNLSEPYNSLNGLRIRDMEDLAEDIKVYLELDSSSKINADYWRDLQIIVEDELTKLKLANMDLQERRREGINPSVSTDIAKILKGKSPAQLKTLQSQVEKKITSHEEGIDIGFWETLLSRLRAQIARARLREFHEDNLIKRESLIAKFRQEIKNLGPVEMPETSGEMTQEPIGDIVENKPDEVVSFLSEVELQQKCLQDYDAGRYSPKLINIEEVPTGTLLLAPEDYVRDLDEERTSTMKRLLAFPVPFVELGLKSEEKPKNYDRNTRKMTRDEEAFVREARKGMGDDEAIFSVEEELVDGNLMHKQVGQSSSAVSMALLKDKYNWAEKYRPRKPRYFNRVHTGFEWNKYNQTHYDVDNPPPKVVQGYKFNIFYPDLIDKSVTPRYKITPCSDNREFAYIRFSAGPPYEDICFKIVNREWNYSYKSGFRCQFQNNILQLWFHFKRYRYRR